MKAKRVMRIRLMGVIAGALHPLAVPNRRTVEVAVAHASAAGGALVAVAFYVRTAHSYGDV
jgi:hypothetical protein